MPFPETCPPGYVAVVTDVHPDEWTSKPAYDLYALLDQEPIDGVWAIRANELTLQRNRESGANQRCTDVNMQTLRPAEQATPDAYEVQRRPQVVAAVEGARYVIEPHANRGELTYGIYAPSALPAVRGILGYLGIDRALINEEVALFGRDPRQVGIDFSLDAKRDYLATMYELLSKLAAGWEPDPQPLREYAYMPGISVADARRMGLPEEKEEFEPFTLAEQAKLVAIGRPAAAVALGWSYRKYGIRNGFMGELALPLPPR